ncbi:MAG TPA: hypothetical protein VD993_15515 [Chitinophagaceae bacterium]|nr:hypothetical protein [Chitinophagaceae bacterium]
MKNIYTIAIAIFLAANCCSQDKILSFGYAKNFVNKDSSNVAIAIDLNRIPGRSEATGSLYLVNVPLGGLPFNFYLKPTADVNLGSYTTSAANNISIGGPLGIAYLIPEGIPGNLYAALEIAPEIIAEKNLNQYLYYISPGLFLNYSYTDPGNNNIIDFGTGYKLAFGQRLQNVKTKTKNSYRKVLIPIGLSLSLWQTGGGFHRIKFTGVYKFNSVLKDDMTVNPRKDNSYTLLKLDFYIIRQLGINMTYNAGYEEPLFKKTNSLSFGITLAR